MPASAAWFARILATYTILCVATFLMLRTVITYSSFETDVLFLAQKQEYLPNVAWRTAFHVHVFSAVFALLAGFTQFSGQLIDSNPRLHRWLGRAYVWNILAINFPAAVVMGVYANGGAEGKTAFLLLDVLWFAFTLHGYRLAKQKKFLQHRDFMIRSYALTFSAITLRTWKLFLEQMGGLEPGALYIMEAWLGFVPNLLAAELIVLFLRRSRKQAAT